MEKSVATKPSNRRRSFRRKPRGSAKLECRPGAHGLGPNMAVSVLDLSDSGVRLIVRREMEVGSEAEMLMSNYGLHVPVKRLGTVRWQVKLEDGNYCIGVEFHKLLPYRDWQMLAVPG